MEAGAGDRKLTAILSADVVGYSRLMAEDEAETVKTIGRYREEVSLLVGQHRGRIVDFTGDNVLAEFPTATDAVACALETQRVVEARNAGIPPERRMRFRIGVHLGEVTVEGERLYGDGVNIAARLEALAPAGGVCVSGAVREQVKQKLEASFEDLGTRELKNLPDPVRVFRVGPGKAEGTPAPPATRRRGVSLALSALGVAALLALASDVFVEGRFQGSPAAPEVPSRFRLPALGDGRLSNNSFPPIAVSPDGRTLAYAAAAGDTTRLFLRSLDRFEAKPLPGTEGAVSPFLSPDGNWVGFFAGGTLRKVRTSGGAPVTLCETSSFSFPSASWGADGIIRYTRGINLSAGMMQVPESGGDPAPLTTPDYDEGERWHGLPQLLPGGALLFTVSTANGFRAAVLPSGAERWDILEELGPAVGARFVSSGHLVFGHAGQLMAVPWSPGEHAGGASAAVLEGVHTSRLGMPFFAVAENGTLAYAPGGVVETTPVLLDRRGNATPIADDPGFVQHPRFSPDERFVAVDVTWRGRTDIYVYDLARGTRRRLTHTGFNLDPQWTPDGRDLVFRSTRRASEGQQLYRVPADGSGEPEVLLAGLLDAVPGSWGRDGSLLVYTDISQATRALGLGVLDLDAGSAEPLARTPYNVGWPVLSPDGRRVAYVSDESGRREVWVRAFPGPGAATQVSVEGGIEPVWSPDGSRLYFRRGESFYVVGLGDDGLRPGAGLLP